jgi:hypothetical protein
MTARAIGCKQCMNVLAIREFGSSLCRSHCSDEYAKVHVQSILPRFPWVYELQNRPMTVEERGWHDAIQVQTASEEIGKLFDCQMSSSIPHRKKWTRLVTEIAYIGNWSGEKWCRRTVQNQISHQGRSCSLSQERPEIRCGRTADS